MTYHCTRCDARIANIGVKKKVNQVPDHLLTDYDMDGNPVSKEQILMEVTQGKRTDIQCFNCDDGFLFDPAVVGETHDNSIGLEEDGW